VTTKITTWSAVLAELPIISQLNEDSSIQTVIIVLATAGARPVLSQFNPSAVRQYSVFTKISAIKVLLGE
jgi:hypothetical protein